MREKGMQKIRFTLHQFAKPIYDRIYYKMMKPYDWLRDIVNLTTIFVLTISFSRAFLGNYRQRRTGEKAF